MSTVPNAPGGSRGLLLDPLGRRREFADVFATVDVRPEVAHVAALCRRGLLDFAWIKELFAVTVADLVAEVRRLDRHGLRSAYRLLFVEEPLLAAAMRMFLFGDAPAPVHVADAIGEVIAAVTQLDELGLAWSEFMFGAASDADR